MKKLFTAACILFIFSVTAFAQGSGHLCQPTEGAVEGALFYTKFTEKSSKLVLGYTAFYRSVDSLLTEQTRDCPALENIEQVEKFVHLQYSTCANICNKEAAPFIESLSPSRWTKNAKISVLKKECVAICGEVIREELLVLKGLKLSQQ